jgi:hypothetical protein
MRISDKGPENQTAIFGDTSKDPFKVWKRE